jgi:surface protein
MHYMFQQNLAFNQDISGWNVGNVDDMQHMFRQAAAFTFDLSSWDVGSVTNFASMFNAATAFKDTYPGVVDTPNVQYFPYNGNQLATGSVTIAGTSELGQLLTQLEVLILWLKRIQVRPLR